MGSHGTVISSSQLLSCEIVKLVNLVMQAASEKYSKVPPAHSLPEGGIHCGSAGGVSGGGLQTWFRLTVPSPQADALKYSRAERNVSVLPSSVALQPCSRAWL